MKYAIVLTKQYLRDVKLAKKRKLDINKLNKVVQLLAEDTPLPPRHKDHALSGNYQGYRECHITPDWLLIYTKDTALHILSLVRNGSHSDLF